MALKPCKIRVVYWRSKRSNNW